MRTRPVCSRVSTTNTPPGPMTRCRWCRSGQGRRGQRAPGSPWCSSRSRLSPVLRRSSARRTRAATTPSEMAAMSRKPTTGVAGRSSTSTTTAADARKRPPRGTCGRRAACVDAVRVGVRGGGPGEVPFLRMRVESDGFGHGTETLGHAGPDARGPGVRSPMIEGPGPGCVRGTGVGSVRVWCTSATERCADTGATGRVHGTSGGASAWRHPGILRPMTVTPSATPSCHDDRRADAADRGAGGRR